MLSSISGRAQFGSGDLHELARGCAALEGPFDVVASSIEAVGVASREIVTDLTTLRERAALVTALHRAEENVQTEEPRWTEVLGPLYRSTSTDWESILTTIDWLREFDQRVGSSVPTQLQSLLVSPERRLPDFAGLGEARGALFDESRKFAEMFDERRQLELDQLMRQEDFQALVAWIRRLRDHLDDLYDWVEFRSWRTRATDRGWGAFVDALVEAELPGGDVVPAYRRAFWNRRLEVLFKEEPTLADRGATYARWIEEFKSLDRRLVRTAADRLISARNRERPAQVAFRGSQTDLLRREGAKRRRHMPVRKLLEAIPTVLSELKPCLMMSPLTVSHFLAPDHEFDLVVFDEASQVPPQDAINCIYRGKQLIVAGDSRQLPPTPFFQAEVEGVWDENDDSVSEDMESILDACEALLPAHPLRWHYRSRHEHLIAFSNHYVYDRGLHTFPSADVVTGMKGVRFLHVPDGVYERGRSANVNRREARVVAERVMEHLRAGRTSVGVIAFNTQQSDTIAQELERLRIEQPELEEHFSGDRLESVFVKHLESVQGDERDVIVFSVGFGRDAGGKFTMNFGPLNKDGGFRRLNVAVTRARELVEVVASVRSADFSLSESSSRGARLLKDYIHYAETGGSSLAGGEETEEPFASPLEAEIGRAIQGQGLEPEAQIGVGSFRVDVGVRSTSGDRYLLGVTTDGPVFSRTPTARDRERLREDILAKLGWHTHRIWALDWVRNRNSEIERLKEALGLSSEATQPPPHSDDDSEPPPRERADRMVVDLLAAVDAAHFEWVTEYQRVDLPRHRRNYEFHETVNRDAQRDLVVALAQTEAPIHSDYAIRRLAHEWGVRRVGGRIRPAGLQAIKMAERRELIELRGAFIWLPQQELTHVRSPNWSDKRTFRAIEEIPPEEIDLAFEKLSTAGVTEEAELIPVVAKILGFDRVGAKIRPVLESRFLAVQSRGGSD